MKTRLLTIALAALTVGLLGSCSKIDERISNLEKRIDGIESNQIASIKSQVDAINTSIADLGTIRQNVQTLMNTVPSKEDIEELRRADEALGRRIDELKSYTDGELKKYATIEWVKATFATLEQHQWTCDTIAKIDARIGALDANLSQSISGLESSLKQWVNEQLDAYYTAAQMDAKLDVMRNDINNAKAQGKTATDKADSLATELTTLKTAVDTAKAAIRTEYKNAIDVAINKLDGEIRGALLDSIAAVNGRIEALDTRVTTLEGQVLALEGKVDKLLAMVQSVTIVPVYTDGSVESTNDGVLYLDIIVSPAQAVATLTKDSLKVLVNEVKTRAVDVDTVAVTKFKADAAKGTITARADISSKLPVASGKALTIAVNVKNGISDYTTEFCPVYLSSEPNVTVNDETDTTKVTIKADEDFPESIIGNIEVDKLAGAKPTSITVGGIGNVIFDKTATDKIKTNAAEVQATSVVFKVEDVTTTKPVPNADVVLEVTMKAVDKIGTEVFCDGKAEGEVTIQIPMDENVAYVNSVTLVDENDNPIPGGVVPDSEKIENGKLIFKVNHFSKYAIDYVTTAEYKAVTGVNFIIDGLDLPVGDEKKLSNFVTIAPEDATNKKVTWSSSDTTKVKVDDTGKITAVAFGQATITVTTVDGNKTADCTVKVFETKTMADILGTNTGIPESEDMTPPANAWVKSTDPDCKAFVGIDAADDTLFVIMKEGLSNPPGVCMNDEFEKIDDNTYKHTEPDFTFTVKMAEGKFTSLEFNTNIESIKFLNGTYSAPAAPTEYTVTFDLNGITGTAPTSQTIEKGGNVTKPADPTYANHTFAGWYKTKDATTGALSDPWDFDNDTVTADMTLYANWTRTMMDLLGDNFPKNETSNSAPGNAWKNGNGCNAFIYNKGKSFMLDPGNSNGLPLFTSTQFTRISDGKYVFEYVSGNTRYGVITLNIEDSTLVSIEYEYNGTDPKFVNLTGTYTAPTPTTTGTAKATIGGSQVDVNWVQLWENGPKFAEYNVGVTDGKAESYGGYYCWGKAIDKDSSGSYKNGESALSGDDDTATALWGENWRMPKQTELQALLSNCNVAWTNVNGKDGRKFTGKGAYASNSVFLPAAGYYNGGSAYYQGSRGHYWSSTPDGSDDAFSLNFDSGRQGVGSNDRRKGYSVRAVLAE